ncbi:uncharacterized protein IL334_007465 [Kwoniella shivajii]|uniref:FAD/NAD(P)-binding domain-containing protein n=1 Tax=Kwoniella shivajii TaxID=564305 RepID=A0ABZ1DCP8_9TREE|nr:hypothetical protein IL334_007465 [Kwoniella shivajii]
MTIGQQVNRYEAVIVGAGPGGISTIISLLDAGIRSICWIDRSFGGGRLNELYREISSNTKVGIYLDAVHSSSTCRQIAQSSPSPNALDELEKIDKDETCQLSLAGDMIKMIEKGVLEMKGVTKIIGEVQEAKLEGSTWTIKTKNRESPMTTQRLFLCTGSHPIIPSFHEKYNPDLKVLDLDRCMVKSTLPSLFPSGNGNGEGEGEGENGGKRNDERMKSVVGVIGNSHSGILVCRNLYEITKEGLADLRIINFSRRGIKYAEYTEDGIIFDNTGLKGSTADWSKENMNKENRLIEQIDLRPQSDNSQEEGEKEKKQDEEQQKKKEEQKVEDEIYQDKLNKCTHLIYAVGYEKNQYPKIIIEGEQINDEDLQFDQHTSGFTHNDRRITGLYGLGIAHPEKTEDPKGHIEDNVGVTKFLKFAERVQDTWVKVQ